MICVSLALPDRPGRRDSKLTGRLPGLAGFSGHFALDLFELCAFLLEVSRTQRARSPTPIDCFGELLAVHNPCTKQSQLDAIISRLLDIYIYVVGLRGLYTNCRYQVHFVQNSSMQRQTIFTDRDFSYLWLKGATIKIYGP